MPPVGTGFLRAGTSAPHAHDTAVLPLTSAAAHGAEPRWSVAAPPGLDHVSWERVREFVNCGLTSATASARACSVRVARDGSISCSPSIASRVITELSRSAGDLVRQHHQTTASPVVVTSGATAAPGSWPRAGELSSARLFRFLNCRVCMIQWAGSQNRKSAIAVSRRGLELAYPLTRSLVRLPGSSSRRKHHVESL